MTENDYLESCPVCGFFGTLREFLQRVDKWHCRLICPNCEAATGIVESQEEAIDKWMNREVTEAK